MLFKCLRKYEPFPALDHRNPENYKIVNLIYICKDLVSVDVIVHEASLSNVIVIMHTMTYFFGTIQKLFDTGTLNCIVQFNQHNKPNEVG